MTCLFFQGPTRSDCVGFQKFSTQRFRHRLGIRNDVISAYRSISRVTTLSPWIQALPMFSLGYFIRFNFYLIQVVKSCAVKVATLLSREAMIYFAFWLEKGKEKETSRSRFLLPIFFQNEWKSTSTISTLIGLSRLLSNRSNWSDLFDWTLRWMKSVNEVSINRPHLESVSHCSVQVAVSLRPNSAKSNQEQIDRTQRIYRLFH